MEIKKSSGEYLAPEVKVIELQGQGVLCASGENPDFGSGWDKSWNDLS